MSSDSTITKLAIQNVPINFFIGKHELYTILYFPYLGYFVLEPRNDDQTEDISAYSVEEDSSELAFGSGEIRNTPSNDKESLVGK